MQSSSCFRPLYALYKRLRGGARRRKAGLGWRDGNKRNRASEARSKHHHIQPHQQRKANRTDEAGSKHYHIRRHPSATEGKQSCPTLPQPHQQCKGYKDGAITSCTSSKTRRLNPVACSSSVCVCVSCNQPSSGKQRFATRRYISVSQSCFGTEFCSRTLLRHEQSS